MVEAETGLEQKSHSLMEMLWYCLMLNTNQKKTRNVHYIPSSKLEETPQQSPIEQEITQAGYSVGKIGERYY